MFHNVFVDLRMIVRPGGLVVLDDYTAARYFETNLGWRPHAAAIGTPGALRLPYQAVAPGFKELTPFWPGA